MSAARFEKLCKSTRVPALPSLFLSHCLECAPSAPAGTNQINSPPVSPMGAIPYRRRKGQDGTLEQHGPHWAQYALGPRGSHCNAAFSQTSKLLFFVLSCRRPSRCSPRTTARARAQTRRALARQRDHAPRATMPHRWRRWRRAKSAHVTGMSRAAGRRRACGGGGSP